MRCLKGLTGACALPASARADANLLTKRRFEEPVCLESAVDIHLTVTGLTGSTSFLSSWRTVLFNILYKPVPEVGDRSVHCHV
jgi:hypothetical protein